MRGSYRPQALSPPRPRGRTRQPEPRRVRNCRQEKAGYAGPLEMFEERGGYVRPDAAADGLPLRLKLAVCEQAPNVSAQRTAQRLEANRVLPD
jgi:hypothetical protein